MTVNSHHTFENCLKNETQMSQDFYHLLAMKELAKWLNETFDNFLI